MTDALSWIDPNTLVSGAMGVLTVGVLLGGAVLIAAGLWVSGILKRSRFTCFIWEARAGNYQVHVAKGDYMKGGKFEVIFGPFDKMVVPAPPNSAIRPGNQIHGFSYQRNDIAWNDGPSITINDETTDVSMSAKEFNAIMSKVEVDKKTGRKFIHIEGLPNKNIVWSDGDAVRVNSVSINSDPSLDPGMKIAVWQSIIEEFERYKEQNKWQQYIPMMGIAVAAIIIILPLMLGLGNVADKLNAAASAISANIKNQETIINYLNATTPAANSAPQYPRPPG